MPPISHAEVGAYLLGLWGLPFTVVEAVAYHHRPMDVPHDNFDVVDVVYVASALGEEAVLDPKRPGAYKLDVDYLTKLGVADSLPAWRTLSRERNETK